MSCCTVGMVGVDCDGVRDMLDLKINIGGAAAYATGGVLLR